MTFSANLRIPVATYRLQFNQSFTFQGAAHVIPYLHALGITHCYCSPYLKAIPGSTHGYDVVDPTSLNPELGTESDYQEFVKVLQNHGMSQILDIVPNHMGIAHSSNPWWQDVLENGPSSRYATFFDIDWTPVKPELENKVLLPILGDQYGIVLENQEITLCFEDGQFYLQYYEHRFPIDPATWILILTFDLHELTERVGKENPDLQELESIITALTHLPQRDECDPQRIDERYREKEVIRRRLVTLTQDSPTIAAFLKKNLLALNGTKNFNRSFDLLDALVSNQAYRLAYWRVAAEEINYRRFFDVNQLAAIRIDQPGVFQEVHQCVFDLLQSGAVTALRIDHIDGLYDPRDYLRQWQTWASKELGIPSDERGRCLFILVEKILGKGETLSQDWPVHGTTGYDFLNLLNNIFVDPSHKKAMTQIYGRFLKEHVDFENLVYENKNLIMSSSMSSEINSLGHQLNLLAEQNRRSRDFTFNSLIHAVREIIACFPIYRTYVTQDSTEKVADHDRAYIRLAVARAKQKNPAMSNLVFDFVRELLLKLPSTQAGLNWEDTVSFVMRFQQTTSPVTAKGVEDTAFYRYNRLVSLNEVGGEPDQFGIPISLFHERMVDRQAQWPYTLSSTSTHDTKRGEDVRARINVLSELPQRWRQCISQWHRRNKKAFQIVEDQIIPDRNEEYLLYQTLLGSWPWEELDDQRYNEFVERIQGYMNKALREAKVHTSWLNPNEAYETAIRTFIATILSRSPSNSFLKDFLPFQQKIAWYGLYNSLAQVLIKITAPGIPDLYQGTELWALSLVDPDNRGPVDYHHRCQLLKEILSFPNENDQLAFLKNLLKKPEDGRIKLFVTWTTLNFRKNHANLFLEGDYVELEPQGERAQHVCAFARTREKEVVLTIVPRLTASLIPASSQFPMGKEVWRETWIPVPSQVEETSYQNILTGEVVHSTTREGRQVLPMETLFQHFPCSLLESIA